MSRRPRSTSYPLREYEQIVRTQFSLPHVVYAGAHTGCSCGFRSDDDRAALARSRAALIEYIRQASTAAPVELFVCWADECGKRALFVTERDVDALAADDDWLQELTFTRIR